MLVDVDTDGKEWVLLAATFSEYVYSCVWDYTLVLGQPAVVQAQNSELSEAALAGLGKLFRSEVRTHGWPGNAQYRFGGKNRGVLIWSADKQADWFIGATDAESLRAALEIVWQFDAVGDSFYSCTDLGQQVLSALRKDLAKGAGE